MAWDTLYRNVLDVNQADLALVIGEIPDRYQNATILSRAKYILHVPEYEDWADAMELIPNKTSNWREKVFSSVPRKSNLFGAANGTRGSGALVFMYRFFASEYLIR